VHAEQILTQLADPQRAAAGKLQLARLLFPYPAASPELLARIDEFLTARPRDPTLTRLLTDRRDIVQRALRSRTISV